MANRWPIFPEQLCAQLRALADSRPPEAGGLNRHEEAVYAAGWQAALVAVATACGLEGQVEYRVLEGKREPD